MKEKPGEPRLPRKVSFIQRFRSYVKEEDTKKKPVTNDELEKIKKFDAFIGRVISKIDPLTMDAFDVSSLQATDPSFDKLVDRECLELYQEYITEPQKQKKSKSYLEFSECKKRFDLVLNREDPQQDDLLASRFEIYNSTIPISSTTIQIFSFLSLIPKTAEPLVRRSSFLQALAIQQRQSLRASPEVSIKDIASEVLKIDPPPLGSLNTQEKMILLRALPKHLGDWEKISKEYKEKPIPVELLKKIWRCLKVTMKEEVADIKKRAPNYHYIKWLRAAVRKLEQNYGKKKPKGLSINPKPKEQRLDMLSIMAEAENAKCNGIQSSTSLNINASSSFKAYGIVGTLQELCN